MPRVPLRPKRPVREQDLCELLSACARELEWTVYPEQGGWDVLLALPDGSQVGVQAKLRPNLDVLAQTIVGRPTTRQRRRRTGVPDVRAVLVPFTTRSFTRVADELEVLVLCGDFLAGRSKEGAAYLRDEVDRAPRIAPFERVWLPPFVPTHAAGVPSPRTVSPWRVEAARLCAKIREGEGATAKELAAHGMTLSTWLRWLAPVPGTRPRVYRPINPDTLPDVSHPEVSLGLGLPDPRPAWMLRASATLA